MKDIPIFTTANGAASLILKEIAYQGIAYIKLRSSHQPDKLLEECVSFCRMTGAERIYASGHDYLKRFPFHTAILQMRASGLPETDAALWPVQKNTLDEFREIYNRKIRNVPNAAWMTQRDAAQMLCSGGGYFVHREEKLLGIGVVEKDTLRFVASVSPGAGADVVSALCHAMTGDTVLLEVASTNEKAVRLYQDLGFITCAELSRWYWVR